MPVPVAPQDRQCRSKIRIGCVSPDFRQYALQRLIEPVLENHDHAAFEVHAYASLQKEDAASTRLRQLVDAWHPIAGMTDVEVANLIRRDGIDILIDLAGHTAGNILGVFAHRPAPVQIGWLGYAGSTGLAVMDYRLTDALADPPESPTPGSEALLRLPAAFFCYAPPSDCVPVLEENTKRKGIVFGAPHKLIKLNEHMLALWADILKHTPDSRLRIVRDTLDADARKRLLGNFAQAGIDPDRIELVTIDRASAQRLDHFRDMDIVLDTFPWNGHVTILEAL